MLEIIGDAVASGGAAALASEVIAARKSQADPAPREEGPGGEDPGDGVAADDASDEAVAPEAAAAPEAAEAEAEAEAAAEAAEAAASFSVDPHSRRLRSSRAPSLR